MGILGEKNSVTPPKLFAFPAPRGPGPLRRIHPQFISSMSTQVEHYQHKLAYELDSADLYEALQHDASVVVIDARQAAAYAAEHIPGAVSFGHRLMDAASTAALDRRKVYVTYCDGIGCNASTKGALKLSQLGFQVKELMGGLDWWKRDGYATEGQLAPAPEAGAASNITCNC